MPRLRVTRFRTIALAAAAATLAVAVPRANPPVIYIPSAQVSAAFAKGAVLINNGSYQVHASRREASGQVEVHERDTDIIYLLDGETTFVTGGSMVGGTRTEADEIRGTDVHGGESRRLVKGDVVIVPNGTPHWFKDVKGPVLYYVVKVR